MKTIIVNIPEKDENLFTALLNKFGYKSRLVSADSREDKALGKWIEKGLKTEEVTEEIVFSTLRKHGVKI